MESILYFNIYFLYKYSNYYGNQNGFVGLINQISKKYFHPENTQKNLFVLFTIIIFRLWLLYNSIYFVNTNYLHISALNITNMIIDIDWYFSKNILFYEKSIDTTYLLIFNIIEVTLHTNIILDDMLLLYLFKCINYFYFIGIMFIYLWIISYVYLNPAISLFATTTTRQLATNSNNINCNKMLNASL